MEYRAVTKSDPKELTHWKYIKREKVNGKYRYYYDSNTAKEDAKNTLGFVKQEGSRSAQNIKYDTMDKVLEYEQKKASYSNDLRRYITVSMGRGGVVVLKTLNNIGDGTLDDSLISFTEKLDNKINKLFKKVGKLKVDIINKINGKKTKKINKPTLSDPNGKILKENIIKENIIKENIIR